MLSLDEQPSNPPRTVVPLKSGDSLVLAARLLADHQRSLTSLPATTAVSLIVPERFVPALCAEVDRFLGQTEGTASTEQAESYMAGYGVRLVWVGRAGAISLDEVGLMVL